MSLRFFSLFVTFCLASSITVTVHAKRSKDARGEWSYVESRLKKAGFKSSFIKSLKSNYETKHFRQVVDLNVLLFLKKSDYHGVQVNNSAVDDVKKFMTTHESALQKAQSDHGVSGSVIASLLWIESRYGENKGHFHVPSVYAHLLQVDRPQVISYLHRRAGAFTKKINQKILKEITLRTHKKANWALDELKAIQTMYGKDKKVVAQLRGSFAGAFGMSQFIPSSYVKWARPFKAGSVANLSQSSDAVYSVGFYLSDHGWKKAQAKTHVEALMKYNNSSDYANAILKLAQQVDSLSQRKPSDLSGEVAPMDSQVDSQLDLSADESSNLQSNPQADPTIHEPANKLIDLPSNLEMILPDVAPGN